MTVTIKTKDVGDIKDRKCYGVYKWQFEDRIERWIKKELRMEDKW